MQSWKAERTKALGGRPRPAGTRALIDACREPRSRDPMLDFGRLTRFDLLPTSLASASLPCTRTVLSTNNHWCCFLSTTEVAASIYFFCISTPVTVRTSQLLIACDYLTSFASIGLYQYRMWSKVSSALKLRPGTPGPIAEEETTTGSGDVLASVFEQHPNLSVFHQPSEVPFPSPSPPASPSRNGRRGMFKRMSKSVASNNDAMDTLSRHTLTKKVRSTFQGPSTGAPP